MTDLVLHIGADGARHVHLRGERPAILRDVFTADGDDYRAPADAATAAALREAFEWCRPSLARGKRSIGLGDRLGLATAGHLRAIRESDYFPVLAQQSMREMGRAGRTPQQVMDDAMWGVIEADWRGGWGCDADHLKTIDDIDRCAEAGYIAYTLDPGAFVDETADHIDAGELDAKIAALPWDALRDTPDANLARYADGDWPYDAYPRAAAKYGRALAHVVALSEHLAATMGAEAFDLEISVDETDSVTTFAEHRYLAAELMRLGVPFNGLAPRYPGRFEKGVDYLGDLEPFAHAYAKHAAIARASGGYKLSLHSGSDKFSLFPIVARESGAALHVKTSGTSWLEALRAIAGVEPSLFRAIARLAIEGWEANRVSYHVSADPAQVMLHVEDSLLPMLLDQFNAREVLHVAFGAALAAHGGAILAALAAHREAYHAALHAHFGRHLRALA